jgi:hypothetical protein
MEQVENGRTSSTGADRFVTCRKIAEIPASVLGKDPAGARAGPGSGLARPSTIKVINWPGATGRGKAAV